MAVPVSHGASSSSSPAPFLTKTYEMVDDPATDAIVSWSQSNSSFVVWRLTEFSRDLLPKYFKHNNFSSFVRQLNTYGFRKIVPERWEFANEEFVRGQRHLLKNIHRKKAVHCLSLHEDEKHELEEEIDRLKHDKQILVFELQKHTVQQHGMESLMQVLEERLHIMEQRQKDIVAFLTKVAATPGCVPDLFNRSNLQHKKRRLPKIDYFFEEANNEEKQILSFPAVKMEREDFELDTELFDNMEASISSLEAFFCNVSEASGEDLWNDDRMLCQPSLIIPTKTNALSEEANVNHVENMFHDADLSVNQSTRTEISTLPTIVNDAFWE